MVISFGVFGIVDIYVHNIGNVEFGISLTMGMLSEGWLGGFLFGRDFSMEMN